MTIDKSNKQKKKGKGAQQGHTYIYVLINILVRKDYIKVEGKTEDSKKVGYVLGDS